MSNKKVLSLSLLVFASFLISGVALAATTTPKAKTAPVVVKYTADQQTCINNAQRKATLPALEAFNTATSDASKTRQAAIIAAQKITNEEAKASAIKAANDAYNNDATVKQARAPYMAAIKSARADAMQECTGTASLLQAIQGIFQKSFSALTGGSYKSSKTVTKPAPVVSVKYTTTQQACINQKVATAVKPAQVTLTAATPNAIKTKQAAIQTAQKALVAATPAATKTEQAAIQAAMKIKDATAKNAAIKAANDAYNNDSTVKAAKVAYTAAIKAANDAYNNDSSVKSAMPTYENAITSARAEAIKECTTTASSGGANFLQIIGNLFKKAGSSLLNAFSIK